MTISAKELERVGIRVQPEELEAILFDVLAHMRPVPPVADPRQDLTAADAMALTRGGFDLEPTDHGRSDPLARTAAAYAALLATGLTVADAAALLGVDTSRVRQRLAARTLYGIKTRAGWRLPHFQFESGRQMPGIDAVLPHLDPGLHPVAVASWFETPNVDLIIDDAPVSPRDWLRSGGSVSVVAGLAADL